MILGFKDKANIKRPWYDRAADYMTRAFGTVWFFATNALFFLVWIVLNLGLVPGIEAFDPFPFGFLTMIVSLEAIFLSVIVLMSQNRESEISNLRQELDFSINVRAEEEITRIIKMLDEIHDHLGLDPKDDPELKKMKQKINIQELGENILKNNEQD